MNATKTFIKKEGNIRNNSGIPIIKLYKYFILKQLNNQILLGIENIKLKIGAKTEYSTNTTLQKYCTRAPSIK
jgi:hypothetical protein